jgi:hypothetical protein
MDIVPNSQPPLGTAIQKRKIKKKYLFENMRKVVFDRVEKKSRKIKKSSFSKSSYFGILGADHNRVIVHLGHWHCQSLFHHFASQSVFLKKKRENNRGCQGPG